MSRTLFGKFVIKLRQERAARLAGRIAEADFYLRQISFFEVAIELANEDLFAAFEQLRCGDYDLLDIAETDSSRFFDAARKVVWQAIGESAGVDGGEEIPRHLLEDHGAFRTEPMPGPTFAHPAEWYDHGDWAELDEAQRKSAYDEQYEAAALKEQMAFEQTLIAMGVGKGAAKGAGNTGGEAQ